MIVDDQLGSFLNRADTRSERADERVDAQARVGKVEVDASNLGRTTKSTGRRTTTIVSCPKAGRDDFGHVITREFREST